MLPATILDVCRQYSNINDDVDDVAVAAAVSVVEWCKKKKKI